MDVLESLMARCEKLDSLLEEGYIEYDDYKELITSLHQALIKMNESNKQV